MQLEPLVAFSKYAKQLLQKYTGHLATDGHKPRLYKLDMAIYKLESDLSARKADMIYDVRYHADVNELEENMEKITKRSMNELLKQYV